MGFRSPPQQTANSEIVTKPSNDIGQPRSETNLRVDESATVASKTPLWDLAVSKFRENCKEEYEQLRLPAGKAEYEDLGLSEGGIKFEDCILNKRLPDAFQEEPDHTNHATIQRLKRWLPTIGNTKGLAMTLARLDPNQLAPYIVAGSFFAIEFLLQTIPADQRESTLEIICDSVIIILKWRSYEENVSSRYRSISGGTAANALQLLDDDLPGLYTIALKLQARIRANTRTRKRFSVGALLGAVEAWKADLAVLKRKDRECAATKDVLKDCLDREDHYAKVLRWIKKEGASDPHHQDMKKKTGMDQDGYQQAGRWFTELDCFKIWLTPETEQSTQRVVWLKGTMGTGKSTLMCQAISKFFEEEDGRPLGELRVAYYYCTEGTAGTGDTNPDKEVVLRSLCRKLASQPNGTISNIANEFYAQYSKEGRGPPNWEDIMRHLLDEVKTTVVLVVDALDECSKPEELLKCLAATIQSCSNVHLLCSSRPHVLVSTYFKIKPTEIDTKTVADDSDMHRFIEMSLKEKIQSPEAEESIFCKPKGRGLEEELRKALRQGADGMFRWVEIWLSILFPPNPQGQVFQLDDARTLISQIAQSASSYPDDSTDNGLAILRNAYGKLWQVNQVNARLRHKDLLPRLFHIVLGALDKLTLNQVTQALRINPEGNEPLLLDLDSFHVEWLCHNFLVATPKANLEWAHQSAKDFVMDRMGEDKTPMFSDVANHIYMSQITLQMMSQINHPAWKNDDVDLHYWRQHQDPEHEAAALNVEVERIAIALLEVPDIFDGKDWDSIAFFVRDEVLNHLQSGEYRKNLNYVFSSESFAHYVVAHIADHLRKICDATSSMSQLERSMESLIASPDSALAAAARLHQFFDLIRSALVRRVQNRSSRYFGPLVDIIYFRRHARSEYPWEDISSTNQHGNTVEDPLRLLIMINTPNKAVVELGVRLSKSTMETIDWNSYAAVMLCLACRCDSYNVVNMFLNGAILSVSKDALLQAKDEMGRLPVHVAAQESSSKVFEALVDAESVGGDDHTPMLYVPDANGVLPIHITANIYGRGDDKKKENERILRRMIAYDAGYATLFPTTLSGQSDACGSIRNQTSMLLIPNKVGELPIHIATECHYHGGVELMLRRELEALCAWIRLASSNDNGENLKYRSRLLHSRSWKMRPIDILYRQGPRTGSNSWWLCMRTILEFDAKWMDLSPRETTAFQHRSDLLDADFFWNILESWVAGLFELEWMDWLLERCELYRTKKIDLKLALVRRATEEALQKYSGEDLARYKKIESTLQRLERLESRDEDADKGDPGAAS